MATEYVCDRCDYRTDIKANFKRHLQKVLICPAINSDISPEEILKRFDKEKNFKCPDCDKCYSTKSSLCVHQKNVHLGTTQNASSSNEQRLQNQVDELRKEMEKMKKDFEKISTVNVNVNNNIVNNNITVQIRDFNFENKLSLNDSVLKEYIQDKELENIVRDLHMNEEHPENFNVRIKNINRNLMEYYSDGKWNIEDMDKMLMDVIHNSRRIAHEFYNSKMKKKETITEWLNALYQEDTSEIKPLKKKLVLLFIQNKDLLLCK